MAAQDNDRLIVSTCKAFLSVMEDDEAEDEETVLDETTNSASYLLSSKVIPIYFFALI